MASWACKVTGGAELGPLFAPKAQVPQGAGKLRLGAVWVVAPFLFPLFLVAAPLNMVFRNKGFPLFFSGVTEQLSGSKLTRKAEALGPWLHRNPFGCYPIFEPQPLGRGWRSQGGRKGGFVAQSTLV